MIGVESSSQSPCLCDNLRQATRLVTRLYDEALRPLDLRITQFSVLGHLARAGESRVRDLADGLALDETTVLRSLRPMEQQRWVKIRQGDDRRERLVSLSPAGRSMLERAVPLWQAAQKIIRDRLSPAVWDAMFRDLPKVAHAAVA